VFARLIKTRPKHVCVRVYLGKITAEIDKIKLRVQVSEIRLEISYTQGHILSLKFEKKHGYVQMEISAICMCTQNDLKKLCKVKIGLQG